MIKKDLEKLQQLEDGWHFGRGEPIPDEVIEEAASLVEELQHEGEAFPLPEGGVQLEFFDGHDEVEVEIHKDLTKQVIRFRNTPAEVTVEEGPIEEATTEDICDQLQEMSRDA